MISAMTNKGRATIVVSDRTKKLEHALIYFMLINPELRALSSYIVDQENASYANRENGTQQSPQQSRYVVLIIWKT